MIFLFKQVIFRFLSPLVFGIVGIMSLGWPASMAESATTNPSFVAPCPPRGSQEISPNGKAPHREIAGFFTAW